MKPVIIEIPLYVRKVRLSEAQRIKYYEAGKAAPAALKYSDRSKYDYVAFQKKSYLVDLSTGERVIKNPRTAGTPREMVINGQKIYNGEVTTHTRNNMLACIKKSFKPYIDKMDVILEYPLKIELEIHDEIKSGGSLWDADNRAYPYSKAFQDCLTGDKGRNTPAKCKQIIHDDNILFVTGAPAPKFIPVDHEDKRKLVFIISKETDPRIIDNVAFQKELDEELLKYIK